MSSLSDPSVPVALWVLVSSSIILTAGRYAIRYTTVGRFHWDDFTHLIALLALIGFGVGVQGYVDVAAQEFAIQAGEEPKPADYAGLVIHGRLYQVMLSAFAWISLWSVKFTFLLFYRLLFDVSTKFMRAWWVVTVFTFVTFWIPIAGVLTARDRPDELYNAAVCGSNSWYQQVLLEYSSAAQIVTDLLIMILPLCMLRGLKIRLSQKLGLTLIFSIAIVTIALEILRTAKSVIILKGLDSVWSSTYVNSILFAVLEISLTVVISCLPVYNSFFSHQRRNSAVRDSHTWNSNETGESRLFQSRYKQSGSVSSDTNASATRYTTDTTSRGVLEHYPLDLPKNLPEKGLVPTVTTTMWNTNAGSV